jgi:ABC-type sugar transport system ATPase subunit
MELGLKVESIYKSNGDTPILKDINLTVKPSEFHLLVGENGAGKSTLVQILCGLIKKDRGAIYIDGSPVVINSPIDAIKNGISFMQQDVLLFDSMTVAENIYVRQRPAGMESCGLVNFKNMNRAAQKLLDQLGFKLKSSQKVGTLSLAQKRMVEIARISLSSPKILVLDDPLTSLGAHERLVFLNMIRKYKEKGTAILYASQQLSKLQKYVDCVTVLKDGHVLLTENVHKATTTKVDRMIWGRFSTEKYPKLEIKKGPEILCVENLCEGRNLRNINFSIAQGEILGITGLVGSGRSSLAKTIFGLTPACSGNFYIDRLPAEIRSPRDAISLGLAYITDDRYNEGLFQNLSILKNAFAIQNVQQKPLIAPDSYVTRIYHKYEKLLNIKKSNPQDEISKMSGGMQQKILLMRSLLTDARLFIFDEPTNGVDIPSKVDIYNLMNDLIRKSGAIIMISSDVEELVGMCDRILVLSKGRIVYEARREIEGEFDDIYRHIF